MQQVQGNRRSFTDIARFGTKKLEPLRRFRPFRGGTPTHDHLGDIFATLDTEKFQRCFVAWVAARTGAAAEVIAIDGKTVRRPGDRKRAKAATKRVWAFASWRRRTGRSGKFGRLLVPAVANQVK